MDISQYTSATLLGPRDASPTSSKTPSKTAAPENVMLSAAGLKTTDLKTPQSTAPDAAAPAGDGFSVFGTLLDTVNPLQHIPGVSTAYQAITGDQSNALANMAGGFLFGGPVGLAAGAATSFLELVTGKGLAGHAMALLGGGETPGNVGGDTGLVQTKAAQAHSNETLFKTATSRGVAQYQTFATAQAEQNKGFGAEGDRVGWAANIRTANALKGAAGLYESNQALGDKKTGQESNRTI